MKHLVRNIIFCLMTMQLPLTLVGMSTREIQEAYRKEQAKKSSASKGSKDSKSTPTKAPVVKPAPSKEVDNKGIIDQDFSAIFRLLDDSLTSLTQADRSSSFALYNEAEKIATSEGFWSEAVKNSNHESYNLLKEKFELLAHRIATETLHNDVNIPMKEIANQLSEMVAESKKLNFAALPTDKNSRRTTILTILQQYTPEALTEEFLTKNKNLSDKLIKASEGLTIFTVLNSDPKPVKIFAILVGEIGKHIEPLYTFSQHILDFNNSKINASDLFSKHIKNNTSTVSKLNLILQGIVQPTLDITTVISALAEKEKNLELKAFSTILPNNLTEHDLSQNKKTLQLMGNEINNQHKWDNVYKIAGICALTAGFIGLSIYCIKNQETIMSNIGGLSLPTSVINAGTAMGGALASVSEYTVTLARIAGSKVSQLFSWTPANKEVIDAVKTAIKEEEENPQEEQNQPVEQPNQSEVLKKEKDAFSDKVADLADTLEKKGSAVADKFANTFKNIIENGAQAILSQEQLNNLNLQYEQLVAEQKEFERASPGYNNNSQF